ncbi:MAG TPA: choice-of-anchor Q domain-containing protein [Verrucomicrobiae bacterium]|nr:choice-of-anchor Q domain-containing protein [Verrucomicrobiae bacterium]
MRETVTNRVAISKPLTVQSVNGPAVTIIEGYQLPSTTNGPGGAVRCVYMTNNTALTGFTLTHGATDTNYSLNYDVFGGGAYCDNFTNCVLSNCVIIANSAGNSGGGVVSGTLNNCVVSSNSAISGGGGGVDFSTLNHCVIEGNQAPEGAGAYGNVPNYDGYWTSLNYCVLIGNSATHDGGGASGYVLNNCLVVGNSAQTGGGVSDSRMFNCTVVSNSATTGAGAEDAFVLNCIVYYNNGPNLSGVGGVVENTEFTCTTPLPFSFLPGNFTDAPRFVNPSTGDYRLQPNSPCINSGNNSLLTVTNNYFFDPTHAYLTVISSDLDDNPRIAGGNVDAGAYEFQSPTSVISYAWLTQNGFPTDGSADFADPDHDGMNNWQEWHAGTIPTDPNSVLKLAVTDSSASGTTVTWQGLTNITYYVQRTFSLDSPFSTIQSDISRLTGTNSFTDTNGPGNAAAFYRVGVQ